MIQNYLQIMKDSLVQKLTLLQQIEEKSKEQADLLKNDTVDMSQIDENMDAKEQLIEKIAPLDDGFDQTYERVKKELLANKAVYRGEILELQNLISKITDISTSIQALEARNKAEIEQYFQREKKNLQVKHTSMRAARDYYENMNKVQVVPPQFMDSRK